MTIIDASAINILNLQLSSNYARLVRKCNLSTLWKIWFVYIYINRTPRIKSMCNKHSSL